MQFKNEVTVTAMKPSKGEYEGKPYDSTRVYIKTGFDDNAEGFGKPSIEYKWGLSQNYYDFINKYNHLTKLDEFQAIAMWENVVVGKSSQLLLLNIEPIEKKA